MTPQQFNRLRADAITNAEKYGTTVDGKSERPVIRPGVFTCDEAREIYADDCGARWAVAGVKPNLLPDDAPEWALPTRKAYMYEEPTLPPDADFFLGGARPIDEVIATDRAATEQRHTARTHQARKLREKEAAALKNPRQWPSYAELAEAFEDAEGMTWEAWLIEEGEMLDGVDRLLLALAGK